MTKKLYYDDCYATRFEATVLSCEKNGELYDVILDETLFFPTGGGQPCDTGTLCDTSSHCCGTVTDVRERGGEIIHTVSVPFEASMRITGEIDFDRRFMLMQNHSGEHLLSGIVHATHGYNNVGFHMGSDFITVDFDGPLDVKQIEEAERAVNEIIWKNIDIIIKYPSSDELEAMNYRSKKELSGQIRIVETPGIDLCACCGLHVKKTGEIGLMKVVEAMSYKGGVRLSILSGSRAFEDYKSKNLDIYTLSSLFSRKPHEITDGAQRLTSAYEEQKRRADTMTEKYIRLRAAALTPNAPVCLFEEELNDEGLRRLCEEAVKVCGTVMALSPRDGGLRYVIMSVQLDMRPFCKELNKTFSGRGGGKSEVCQGSVPAKKEQIEKYFTENIN